MFRSLLARLAATLQPGKRERRLKEEIEGHLAAIEAFQAERGLTLEEAKLAARREFGPVEPLKEMFRDQARFRMLENIFRDLRFALRQCRKAPGFAAAAVLSLALGIGANTALFSFANAILLKRLPVPEPDRLMLIEGEGKPLSLSYEQLNHLNQQATQTEDLFGVFPLDVSMMIGDQPQWVSAELITGDYFRTLEIKPARGRLLTQQDLNDAEGSPVCVISYRLWHNQFQGTHDIIGRVVRLNMRPYKIVGVSERGFAGPDLRRPTDLQIPATRLIDYMPAFVGVPHFDWKSWLYSFSAMARLASRHARERRSAVNRFES